MAILAGCGHGPTPKAPDAMEILRKNQDAMSALKAYRAVCYMEISTDKVDGIQQHAVASLIAEKPTKLRFDVWDVSGASVTDSNLPKTTPEATFADEGTQAYIQINKSYKIQKDVSAEQLGQLPGPWAGGFYSPETSALGILQTAKRQDQKSQAIYDGRGDVDGVPCDIIWLHVPGSEGSAQDSDLTFYIGSADHLVRRTITHSQMEGRGSLTSDCVVRDIDTHPTINPAVFKYTPPPGVILDSGQPTELAKGKPAPDFPAFDADNKRLRLKDLRGKVVVVDFWASWCGPCRESMPHTQAVAKDLQASGVPVVVLAVDDQEPQKDFAGWVADNRSKYPNIRFAYAGPKLGQVADVYGVTGIPSQFVIDKKGVIRANFSGYGGPTDDLKNAILAANKQ